MAESEVPFKLFSHSGKPPIEGLTAVTLTGAGAQTGRLGLARPQAAIVCRHRNQRLHVRHVFLFVFFFFVFNVARGMFPPPLPPTHPHFLPFFFSLRVSFSSLSLYSSERLSLVKISSGRQGLSLSWCCGMSCSHFFFLLTLWGFGTSWLKEKSTHSKTTKRIPPRIPSFPR